MRWPHNSKSNASISSSSRCSSYSRSMISNCWRSPLGAAFLFGGKSPPPRRITSRGGVRRSRSVTRKVCPSAEQAYNLNNEPSDKGGRESKQHDVTNEYTHTGGFPAPPRANGGLTLLEIAVEFETRHRRSQIFSAIR